LNVGHDFKRCFDTVLVGKTCIETFQIGFAAKAEDESAVGAGKGNEFA
jgi:hypothetical protein